MPAHAGQAASPHVAATELAWGRAPGPSGSRLRTNTGLDSTMARRYRAIPTQVRYQLVSGTNVARSELAVIVAPWKRPLMR